MHVNYCLLVTLVAQQIVLLTEADASQTSPGAQNTLKSTNLQKWKLLEESLKRLSWGFAKSLRPHFMKAVRHRNISSQCVDQSLQVLAGMEDLKLWAMRFPDSSGKPIEGLLDATFASFGRYDECLTTMVTGKELGAVEKQSGFTGQYCLMALKPHISETKYFPLTEPEDELKNISNSDSALSALAKQSSLFTYFPMLFAVCVPSGCDRQDVDKIASYVGDQNGVIISSANCEVKQETQYTPIVVSVICCYLFLIFVAITGTALELYEKRRHSSFSNIGARILVAFSFISNSRYLFSTKASQGNIKCLHGIRAIGMIWLILCHVFLFRPQQLSHDVISLTRKAMTFASQPVINGSFVVDSFFFISGFLIGYLAMRRNIKTNKLISYPLYVIFRLFRLYPSLLFIVSFSFLYPFVSSGPLWKLQLSGFTQTCHKNWWTIFAFVHNFYDYDNMCMPHLWYVACEIYLYLIAYFFLLLIIRKRKLGVVITIIAIVLSMICIGIITYVKNLPPTFLLNTAIDFNAVREVSKHLYTNPVDHFGPYIIGLLVGIFMATKKELKMSKMTLILGWCSAIAVNMSVIFGVLHWNNGQEVDVAEGLIYSSCSRVAWTLSIAWLLVCCDAGYGGIINCILCWKVWIPLSRMSLLAYLIHPLVQLVTHGSVDTVLPGKDIFLLRSFIADVTLTYLFSIPVFLMVELPFGTIANLLFPVKAENKKEDILLIAKKHQNKLTNDAEKGVQV